MRRERRRRLREEQQALASDRMRLLFGMADDAAQAGDLGRADRYVELARNIGMRYNVRLPRMLKRRMCKHCHRYLMSGESSRVRTNPRHRRVEVRCLRCGGVMYYPYRRRK